MCWVCINQENDGIIEKWGHFLKLVESGLHFVNPCLANEWMVLSLLTSNTLTSSLRPKQRAMYFCNYFSPSSIVL
jgi:regulator of protease activity HflC (stomatin/prohibitin superfamily)